MAYHVGDVTSVVMTPLPFAITGATLTVYVLKPDGTTLVTRSGADVSIIDGATGQYSWSAKAGDLSAAGQYIVQAKTVVGGVTRYGDPEIVVVDGVLA